MASEIGRNEQIWQQFSKESLDIAMTWPVDKQIRFTRHAKFKNLVPLDQALLFRAIDEALPPAGEPPPDRPRNENPAPPPRHPAPIARASQPVGLKPAWHRTAFVAAVLRAIAWWVATMAVGDLFMKYVMGAS
jgi:hypothetical protein